MVKKIEINTKALTKWEDYFEIDPEGYLPSEIEAIKADIQHNWQYQSFRDRADSVNEHFGGENLNNLS